MKPVVTMKLSGFKESDRALGEMKKATARATLYRVLQPAAKLIDDEWRINAPRLTGRLARSGGIVKTATLVGNAGFAQGMKESGGDRAAGLAAKRTALRESDHGFASLTLGPGRHPEGVQQEFGNVHHAAQPFLTPAWEAKKQPALDIIAGGLGAEIQKTAARLAKADARKAARAS